ncbi:hypothetical protein CWO90_39875 [Bradyrhizobium sp. Leo121]|nr:hypothetical protein CWO90_39875 [Bradyrhizobium sp. Leo121]
MTEQIRADLALLERGDENALGPAGEQPRQIGLAHRQRQPPVVVAVPASMSKAQKLGFMIVAPRMQRVEIGDAVDPEDDGLAVQNEAPS